MTKLPTHLFVSSGDGALYDCRKADWSKQAPLRANYSRTAREINTTADLKATLRAGGYAWPGGYPLYFVTSDGAALSFETVRKELRQIIPAIQDRDNSGWRVVGVDVNWEDGDLFDAHTNDRIPSAYGED